jgi:tetratricopeptide (TPR) repeat protein
LFNQAQQQLRNKAWLQAMQTAAALRSTNVNFRTAQVDGIYYIALRNLGVQKILNEGDLEGGIYDLTLAERFGPLDRDADNYRTWARYYLTGASFWKADWKRVIDYFGQIYFAFPSLRDGSGMTATERYRLANIYYGDKLANEGKYCDARPYYETGLTLSPDPIVQSTLDAVYEQCENPNNGEGEEQDQNPIPSETPPPPIVETPTPEPTTETPTDTPTP